MLLLLLIAEISVAILASPKFYISNKRIIGNKIVPVSEIHKRMNLPQSTNIFRINKVAIVNKLKANPTIKEVRLYRKLPDTLVVRITERKPDLILNAGGVLYEVDRFGVPFRTVKEANPKLPVVSCSIRKNVVLGKKLSTPGFNSARACLLLARKKKISPVRKITVDQNNDLCLNVRDGFQVKLGRPEQLSEKLDITVRSARQFPELRRHGSYIDVTTCEVAPALKL